TGGHVMTNITPAAPTVTFLDNPHAPDVFADGWTGFFTFNGNIKITFESVRVNHVTSPRPGIASSDRTVSDAPGGGRAMAKGLLDFIGQQRTQENPPDQTATRH